MFTIILNAFLVYCFETSAEAADKQTCEPANNDSITGVIRSDTDPIQAASRLSELYVWMFWQDEI